MSASGPQVQRAREGSLAIQFSIFLPNRVGQLSDLLNSLDDESIEVAGISVVDSTDWAVVRMIFINPDRARTVLQRRSVAFTETDVLAIVLEGPGSLRSACNALISAEMNVQFAYPLLIQQEGRPVLALHVDDHPLGRDVLVKHGFALLDWRGG